MGFSQLWGLGYDISDSVCSLTVSIESACALTCARLCVSYLPFLCACKPMGARTRRCVHWCLWVAVGLGP